MAESSAKERSRPWTETELKYFALVLADETNEFAYKLDTLALKKTANKPVFEDIKKAFEERISSEEFKEENDREHPRDVLSHENSDTDSDEEQLETSHSSYQEDDGEEELTSASRKKRVRSQSQAINEIAKSFHALGESQQKRCEKMMEADKERHAEFLAFQKEQAELNRQHELKMLEIIMKYSNPPPQEAQQHLQQQTIPVQPLVPYYNSMP
ncbi:unnamed protein product, partial [Porites lobata]